MGLFYVILFLSTANSLIFFNVFNSKQATRYTIVFSFSILCVLSMFRSPLVGKDTIEYINLFQNVGISKNILHFSPRFEVGYLMLNKAIYQLSTNPQFFLIITSLYIYIIIGRFIYKNSINGWYSFIIFFTLRFFDVSITGVRQMLAISTIILAHQALMNDRFKKYFILLFLSVSIHRSSSIFILSYIIKKFNLKFEEINLKRLFIFLSVTSFFINRIILLVLNIFPHYSSYYYRSMGKGTVNLYTFLFFLLHSLLFIIIQYVSKYHGKNKFFTLEEENIYKYYQLVSVIILFFSLRIDMLIRLSNYFTIFLLTSLPNFIGQYKNKMMKNLILYTTSILFILFSMAIMYFRPEWQSTYPYIFFWE